jgi:hypothetical protein
MTRYVNSVLKLFEKHLHRIYPCTVSSQQETTTLKKTPHAKYLQMQEKYTL